MCTVCEFESETGLDFCENNDTYLDWLSNL